MLASIVMENNLSSGGSNVSGDSIGATSGGSSVGSNGSMNGKRAVDSISISTKSITNDIKELYRYV